MLVIVLIVMQIVYLFQWVYNQTMTHQLMPAMEAAGIILVLYVINQEEDPSYKLGWCVIILITPIIGIPLYLIIGNHHLPRSLRNGAIYANAAMDGLLKENKDILTDLQNCESDAAPLFYYGQEVCHFPVYENTSSVYYPSGEAWFPDYLEALRSAEHFIFIEFFIIDRGEMWNEVLNILKEKAKAGVEVKLIYDDFGCVALPLRTDKELRSYGIEVYRFNKLRPALVISMNNRDHRKITVVDNRVGFTGGVNLADEYANKINRFGYWKDSAIKVTGDSVWSLTVMFLGMFAYMSRSTKAVIDFHKYKLENMEIGDGGFYLPYSDTPTDEINTGMTMHLNMITHAKKYIYIDTPYLIPSEAIITALCQASQNGVDVRILAPHIPDKVLVFQVTRSNYERLLAAGVKIYEFTPGFNHAKNFVIDDEVAIVGSCNMDYRSYYLHFEDGILFAHSKSVLAVRDDFLQSLEKSQEITLQKARSVPFLLKLFWALLTIFMPQL